MQSLVDNSSNINLFIFSMYLSTNWTSQTESYFGKLGFISKIPCIFFLIKKCEEKSEPPQIRTKLLTAPLAV